MLFSNTILCVRRASWRAKEDVIGAFLPSKSLRSKEELEKRELLLYKELFSSMLK